MDKNNHAINPLEWICMALPADPGKLYYGVYDSTGRDLTMMQKKEIETGVPYALQDEENTHKIAQRCHVEIEFGVTKLPRFDVPDGFTSWEYLNKLCFEGLEERYHPVTEELKSRLTYELSTIKNMGYVDYFLIVWDFT